MNAHKKLIAAIVFLAFQVIVILVNGFPKMDSGAYGIGYLIGYLATGVIGLILLVLYLKERFGK